MASLITIINMTNEIYGLNIQKSRVSFALKHYVSQKKKGIEFEETESQEPGTNSSDR